MSFIAKVAAAGGQVSLAKRSKHLFLTLVRTADGTSFLAVSAAKSVFAYCDVQGKAASQVVADIRPLQI